VSSAKLEIAQRFSAERDQTLLSLSLDGGSGDEAVSDQNINLMNSFEKTFSIAKMSQMLNLLGNEDSDDGIKHLKPSKLQKVTK